MEIAGWFFIGMSVICFAIGARSMLEVDILRNEAGDVELWGFRILVRWLKRRGAASKLIQLLRKRARDRREKQSQVLRSEAMVIGVEATAWFAASAFLVAVGGILLMLARS